MQLIRVKLINSDGRSDGCENTPSLILRALKDLKINERRELIEFEKLNLEEIHVNLEDINEADYLIFQNSKEAFERNFKSFFIGGDHYIDYSILRGFNKTQGNPLLIVFDAHADLKGSGENRKWLKKLIIKGEFSPSRIVLISARNLDEEEWKFINKYGISFIGMDVLDENLEDVCDMLMERARRASGFYLSIDMDCVDPGFAPGVVDLEAGGLSSRDLIYFVKRLSLLDNFRGASICEINPEKDVNEMTVKLGAKLISEML